MGPPCAEETVNSRIYGTENVAFGGGGRGVDGRATQEKSQANNLLYKCNFQLQQNCFFERLQPLSLSGLLLHKSFVGWSTAHKIDLKHPQMRFRVYLKARKSLTTLLSVTELEHTFLIGEEYTSFIGEELCHKSESCHSRNYTCIVHGHFAVIHLLCAHLFWATRLMRHQHLGNIHYWVAQYPLRISCGSK